MPPDAPLICVLPGSRRSEVAQHLPLLGQAVNLLWQRFPRIRLVLPTLCGLAPMVKQLVAPWRLPVIVLEDRGERFDAYAASWLAIAASGTVSLEAALAGLPMITIYRTGPVTGWLARRLIKVPHVNLVNLILGRPAVPELLQEDCRPERIAAAAGRLLEDDELRASQRAALAEAVARLGAADDRPPSQRAAARVLEIMATTKEDRMTTDTDKFRLLHTMLRVKDLDAALDFYTNKLGMKLLRKTDFPSGEFTLAFVGYGPEEIRGGDRADPQLGPGTTTRSAPPTVTSRSRCPTSTRPATSSPPKASRSRGRPGR